MRPVRTDIKCDFCSTKAVVARYHAESLEVKTISDLSPIVRAGSHGDWAACEICEALIDKNDWEGVVERAVSTLLVEAPWMSDFRTELASALRSMYVELWGQGFKKSEEPI